MTLTPEQILNIIFANPIIIFAAMFAVAAIGVLIEYLMPVK
jgi:hypothetical protein